MSNEGGKKNINLRPPALSTIKEFFNKKIKPHTFPPKQSKNKLKQLTLPPFNSKK